jgi:hypothetical protein
MHAAPARALSFPVPVRLAQRITFAEMRDGVRGILIYCADYHCSNSLAISVHRWPDALKLSDAGSAAIPAR